MPVTIIKADRLNLRITQKTRYALELAARKEGTSFAQLFDEIAHQLISEKLTEVRIRPGGRKPEEVSILEETWDPLPPDRLVKLAQLAPEYLSDRDRIIWTVIRENSDYWDGNQPKMKMIRNDWDAIEKEAEAYMKKFGVSP